MGIKKRFISLLAAFCLLILTAASGCGVDRENRTTFELSEEGMVTQVIVDDSDGSISGEELENYIDASIVDFQNQNSGETIALETCRVSSEKVNITLVYSSVAAYAAFNNVRCFNGTIKDAYNSGYDFNRSFYSMNGTQIPYNELARYCQGCRVLILEEPVDITLPGDLVVISDGVSIDENGEIHVDENTDESYSGDAQAITSNPVFLIYNAAE